MIWKFCSSLLLITILGEIFSYAEVAKEEKARVRALFLQKSGTPSEESFARLLTPFPTLDDFSVCYRIRLHRFREESTLMTYAVSNSRDNELRMDHRDTGFKVAFHSMWAKTNILTPFDVWTHYCVTFLKLTGDWEIYVDGDPITQGRIPVYSGSIEGNGAYVIGQEQDSFGGDFQQDQSFSGEITELNFWSTKLTLDEIKKVASCDSYVEGNQLAWSQMQWNISGEAEWIDHEWQTLCTQSSRKIIFFPMRSNLKYSIKLCQNIGGKLAVPQNTEENIYLYNKTKEFASYCSGNLGGAYMWLGATDEKEEGIWKYTGTSTPILWQGPWRGGVPNGGNVENCLVMLSGSVGGKWSDIACLETYFFCIPCELQKHDYLYLKGPALCTTSPFNHEYFFEGENDGKPQLMGTFHSRMFWENITQSWILKSLKNKNAVIRFTPREGRGYPFGKRTWVLESEVCGFSPGYKVNLTLSACSGNQFTCRDGSCIDLTERCDLRLNCPDNSDEAGCTVIDVPKGYKNTIPPPPLHPLDPLKIHFFINIGSFPAIRTQDLTFEATSHIHLTWKDTRLTFQNLKKEKSLNRVSTSEIMKIWTPNVFFSNAFGNIFFNLNEGALMECHPNGPSKPGAISDPEERNIFSGLETDIILSQYFSSRYSCAFDLLMFPFDGQSCSMVFTLISAPAEYMVLSADVVEYSGNRDLIEYTIGRLSINSTTKGSFSSIIITVRFIRRFAFYLLTLYVPSVLLVIIAYTTLFFNPGDFNSRIVVALTALLVLSSLFTQTSNSLPKTSYFKLIDIWLFFSTLIIFFVVLFHTLAEYFSFELFSKKKPSSRIFQDFSSRQTSKIKSPPQWISGGNQKYLCGFTSDIFVIYLGRIFIPALYLLFNICYWGSTLGHIQDSVWPMRYEA